MPRLALFSPSKSINTRAMDLDMTGLIRPCGFNVHSTSRVTELHAFIL